MRIVCVKWGDKYGPEYVTKLKGACERHIPHDDFMCMTDAPVPGVQCVPMNTDLPGWWSKLGLFRKGYFCDDILYLDLDVVVTAPIVPFLAAYRSDKSKLWALDDFSYSLRTPKESMAPETRRLLGGAGTINSSVMMWNGKESFQHQVFDNFTDEIMTELHGDQNWITRCLWSKHINLLPQSTAHSFKYGGGLPYPITVFHGDPKPADLKIDWVIEHWAA